MEQAARKLLTSRPPEDSGPRTFNKYRWQALIATRDLLRLVAEDIEAEAARHSSAERWLLCERWEDWTIVSGGLVENVSAKTRDLDQGAWVFSTIFDKGGVAHLYRTHRELDALPRSRLVSNQALLKKGDEGLSALCLLSDAASGSAVSPPSAEEADETAQHVARQLMWHAAKSGVTGDDLAGLSNKAVRLCRPSSEFLKKVQHFLSGLSLDMALSGRRDLDHLGPSAYVQPVLKQLGHPSEHAHAVWDVLTRMVEKCMEADGPTQWGGLADLLHRWRQLDYDEELPPDIARRRITSAQARQTIEHIVDRPRRYLPLAPLPYQTKTGIKMHAGGCRPTAIETAEEQLQRWQQTCATELDDAPGNHAQLEAFTSDLQMQLDDLDDELSEKDDIPSDRYGRALWREATRISPDNLPALPFEITRPLIAGAVAGRLEACRFWLTEERFDADSTLKAENDAYLTQLEGGANREGG